jgi:hypothetical protein
MQLRVINVVYLGRVTTELPWPCKTRSFTWLKQAAPDIRCSCLSILQ